MKQERRVTATELAECCVCEQRVVLDHLRGRRRTAVSRRLMREGTAAHARQHSEALCEFKGVGDSRCFIATALWGTEDPRTNALRSWRDGWLLKRSWGPAAARLYYLLSPLLVAATLRAPIVRALASMALSAIVRGLTKPRE